MRAIMSLAGLAVPVAVYLLIAWPMGYLSAPSVTWPFMAGGMVLSVVMAAAIMIMGESIIEDMIKFAMALGAAIAVSFLLDPNYGAIILGAPIGTGLPIVLRWFAKRRSRG